MQKLNKELEKILGAHHEKAPEEEPYPYKVFSTKRLSAEYGRQTFELEVNVWDQHEYYSRAESIMDELEKLQFDCIITDNYLLRLFVGDRSPLEDPDKSIKRIQEKFELHVYERNMQ